MFEDNPEEEVVDTEYDGGFGIGFFGRETPGEYSAEDDRSTGLFFHEN